MGTLYIKIYLAIASVFIKWVSSPIMSKVRTKMTKSAEAWEPISSKIAQNALNYKHKDHFNHNTMFLSRFSS